MRPVVDLRAVAQGGFCTGLIPWAPNSEDQLDAYDEIINYSPKSANIYNYDK